MRGRCRSTDYLGTNRIALACLEIITLISGCGDSGSGSSATARPSEPRAIVAGSVTGADGAPLAGVTIRIGDETSTTDGDGTYALSGIRATDRAVVTFHREDHVMTCQIVRVRAEATNQVDAVMVPKGDGQALDAAVGGVVTAPDGGYVELTGGTIVYQDGDVYSDVATVTITLLDPTTEQERAAFPGDFEGGSEGGEARLFKSYGFADITIRDAQGLPLELAPGATAAIGVPIPAGQREAAPETAVPHFFDTDRGRWCRNAFEATRTGDLYEFTVDHFSIWTCAVPLETSHVEGRVVDAGGEGIGFAAVAVEPVDPTHAWMRRCLTEPDGSFIFEVEAGRAVKLWAWDTSGDIQSRPTVVTTPPAGESWGPVEIPLPIEPVPSSVVGRVLDGCRAPIADAEVTVVEDSGRLRVATEPDGTFTVALRPNITFTIWATASGIRSETRTAISPGSGGRVRRREERHYHCSHARAVSGTQSGPHRTRE